MVLFVLNHGLISRQVPMGTSSLPGKHAVLFLLKPTFFICCDKKQILKSRDNAGSQGTQDLLLQEWPET